MAALVFALTVLVIKAVSGRQGQRSQLLHREPWSYGSGYSAVVHTDGVAHAQGSSFGALPIIVGTLQSSAIALIVAVPISIGTAFALTERMPNWISRPLGFAIEVLAGIPSVVIGLWGYFTLGPFWPSDVYPDRGEPHARRAGAGLFPQAHRDRARACSRPAWSSAS